MAKMRTYAESFKGYKTIPDSLLKKIIRNMYEGVFIGNPQFYGLWDSWELSVMDSTWDLPYGRTVEEFWRDNGVIRNKNSMKSLDGDNADYARIKKGKVEVVEEPYFYSYTGNKKDEILMTSLIVPIIANGTYVGVVGVDIALDNFQEMVNRITPFDSSTAYLISYNGIYLGHPETKWIGKAFDEQYETINDKFNVIEKIQHKEQFSFIWNDSKTDEKYYMAFAPIVVGKVSTPWSLAIKVPVSVITSIANKNFIIALVIGILGLVILTTIVVIISRNISIPLVKTTNILKILSTGNVSDIEKLKVKNEDEIGEMAESVNTLIDGLIGTSKFADEIGKGNLDAEFIPLSEKDTLGNSLIRMRESLIHAEKEEEKRKKEDQIQKWSTEGIAKFGEILRKNNDNIEELSFQLMSNLINYVNANQGALFILDDTDEEDIYYELTAAIAYGRSKLMNKKIHIGEELVGRCAHEKLTIYLKKIPDDYIEITSGMGTANPKEILIVPVKLADIVYGVIEIASFKEFEPYKIEFIEKIGESIASTISSVKINAKTARLLEQSQKQAEELASQEEEMRQNLEELQATQEESSRREFEMHGLIQALSSSTFTIEYDMKGKITDINEPFLKLIGMTRDQVIGMYHKDGIDFSSQTPEEYEQFWNDLKAGMNKKVINKIDYHGKMIWLSETYSPLMDTEGKPYKVLKIAFDISELKEKEQILEKQKTDLLSNEEKLQVKMDELTSAQLALKQKEEEQIKMINSLKAENEARLERFANKEAQSRAILEASPNSIIIFDENGVIEFFNSAAQNKWGYTAADVIGQDIKILLPGLLERLTDIISEGEFDNKIIINEEKVSVQLANKQITELRCSVFVSAITGKPRYTAFINGFHKEEHNKVKKTKVVFENNKNRPAKKQQSKAVKKSNQSEQTEQKIELNELIKWEEIFKTGLNELDDQHFKLIELVNKFYKEFGAKKTKKQLKDTLKSILDYSAYHFGTEENYFETFNYKDTIAHQKLHKEFIKKISDFQNDYSSGAKNINSEFLNYLQEWFVDHIKNIDSKYVELFKDKGVK
ncbi:MAG: bacteriohemerythrin [Chlorobi bacterium]|nr:bacteriohemerythrin [Chlorobiota bacterium]